MIASGDLKQVAHANLVQGQGTVLDDGTVITFDGAKQFVNLQIAHDPAQKWVLVMTMITLIGLIGSLALKRRRIWVRFYANEDGTTRIEAAGLARTDRAGWGGEFERFAEELCRVPVIDDGSEEFR